MKIELKDVDHSELGAFLQQLSANLQDVGVTTEDIEKAVNEALWAFSAVRIEHDCYKTAWLRES